MTEDDETRSLVRRAGDALPVSPAPVENLLQQGRRAKRRRTLTTVAVVVAGVAVITSGAVAVGAQLSHDATGNPPVATPTMTAPSITVPEITTPSATRLVGLRGIGIVVPRSWGTNEVNCYTAYENTVIVGRSRGGDCMLVPSPVSSVMLTTPGDVDRLLPRQPSTPGDIDGVPVARLSTFSYSAGPEPHFTMYAGALFVKSRNLAIVVSSPHRAVVDRVLDSAFAIPKGQVAIPAEPSQASLVHLGLRARSATRLLPGLIEGWPLGVNPPVGSVVARGSVVTILRSTQGLLTGCVGLNVDVVTPTGYVPLQQGNGTFQIFISVGDTVSLETRGRCGKSVRFGYPESDILENRDGDAFTALGPGTAKVVVTIPMCAGVTDPTCLGGIATLGTVMVHVRR